MNWWDYLKYVVGVAMVIVGIYYMTIGNFQVGLELVLEGLALMGIFLTVDTIAVRQKKLMK